MTRAREPGRQRDYSLSLPEKGEGAKVVITGSVNSSELTLFNPVIHASRPAVDVDGRVRARP